MLGLVIVFSALRNIFKIDFSFDFHLHDTYFIIDKPYNPLLFFLYSLFVYACYFTLRKFNKPISRIIVVIQITGLILPIIYRLFSYNYEGLAGMPRRYYDYSAWESFKTFAMINKAVTFLTLYFIISQLLFFFYFLTIFVKHYFKKD